MTEFKKASLFKSVSKYHSSRITNRHGRFDSRKEYQRYLVLLDMEKHGEISQLERQVVFLLIPSQRDEKGHVIERAVKYKADFRYVLNGVVVVEDVKGVKTKEYVIKRKLMLERYGIRIKET